MAGLSVEQLVALMAVMKEHERAASMDMPLVAQLVGWMVDQ